MARTKGSKNKKTIERMGLVDEVREQDEEHVRKDKNVLNIKCFEKGQVCTCLTIE